MARWKLKAETSGAEGPGSCRSDEAALSWNRIGLSHCSLWSWQACGNSFACPGSVCSIVPEGAPWLVPWGLLELVVHRWYLSLISEASDLSAQVAASCSSPSLSLSFKVHPISSSHPPAPPSAFFSAVASPPSTIQGFLLAWAPKLCPGWCSYIIFHRTLTPSYLSPLWRYPLRISGLHSLSSSITHKPLVSSKQWLSFFSDIWGPKYFPIVYDVMKTYLPVTSNQLIYTNMITWDNDLLLFCPPKNQTGSLQDRSLGNALTSPKGLQWRPFHFHCRWHFQWS